MASRRIHGKRDVALCAISRDLATTPHTRRVVQVAETAQSINR